MNIYGGMVTAIGGHSEGYHPVNRCGTGIGAGGKGASADTQIGLSGSFATDGNAVIFAVGGSYEEYAGAAIGDTSGLSTWEGVIFQGNSGQVYGNQELSNDMEIPEGYTLTIPTDTTFTIPRGVTLTNNGSITGSGTIVVYGTLTGNSAENDVTVFSPVLVTSVTLDQKALSLTVDDTAQLTATVQPEDAYNKNVTWSSSDTSVATVDGDGLITAVAPGTTTITVTTEDGGLTASCTVTVENPEPEQPSEPTTPDPEPSEPSTPSCPSTPSEPEEPSGPSTGESDGWASITDELDKLNPDTQEEPLTIEMNGETEVPKEVFETIAGKDVDVVFDMGDGVSWSVNGVDIPADADLSDLNLGVTMNTNGIPVDVINAITGEATSVQITLAHDGAFGFVLTLFAPLGEENAGYWANLYHYKVNGGEADREDPLGDDEANEAMDFETAAEIESDGTVRLRLTHASQYAIVIDDHSHAPAETTPVSDIFTDVAPDAWYIDAVQYAYDNGLMTGTSATTFEPNTATTRGMIVSILHRLEDSPVVNDLMTFDDVADGEWYAEAVRWAASENIVAGFEDNTFGPNDPITREQLAAILYNYAQRKGMDVSARTSLDAYNDQPSEWANDVMEWAVAEGLISGTSATTLDPQGTATRAQVAAILQRFLEN